MFLKLQAFFTLNLDIVTVLFGRYRSLEKKLVLKSDLWDEFRKFCEEENLPDLCSSPLGKALFKAQEAAIDEECLCLAIRPKVAQWLYVSFCYTTRALRQISVSDFLAFKEKLAQGNIQQPVLEFDLQPFERDFPKMNQSRSIGHGVEFLNRVFSNRLSRNLSGGDALIFSFLQVHGYGDEPFMINDSIKNVQEMVHALSDGLEYVQGQPANSQWHDMAQELGHLGFEPGWGRSREQIEKSFSRLANLLEAPDHQNLERFISAIPMIFNIVVLSPHGFFGQENVLGLPDTGGQIVYILDQVRALEKEMQERIYNHGLDIQPKILIVTRLIPEAGDTTCNVADEPVRDTDNVNIIRVPFRRADGSVLPHWISRFEVWPYLERFADEAREEVLHRLDRRPDLVIGNYSDGNLVSYLMAKSLDVTQCTIAHALEKTKYLYSALYWKEMEEQYHFSCQFTADLIAMNAADFIITSTYQEIAGSSDVVGQYESYSSFTMPGLQRVLQGVDAFDPKFNIVSPGADENIYFPSAQQERRFIEHQEEITSLIFGGLHSKGRGILADKEKPLLFSMARLDRIKNLTGLVQWFGENEQLRQMANLVIIGGDIDPAKSGDEEERSQIQQMHELFESYGLDTQVRWLGLRLDKRLSGELYRCIADHRGVFVQPAYFEAFGLTVIEAMASGLPTFATRYGGPLEIIEDGISGFHIDPNHGDASSETLLKFFQRCAGDKKYWQQIADGGIQRVKSHYTWSLYAKRLLSLTCMYGFWKYATNLERQETSRYLEMLYHLQFRRLAAEMEQ
ncbi:MAG: sucrose synthase [Desulfobulbaceae bacterium]|nr:sucrose synthase [Desulfobulbaceae bacterium]